MQGHKLFFVWVLALSLTLYGCSEKETPCKEPLAEAGAAFFQEPIGYVNDFENLFTAEERGQLTKFMAAYKQRTTNEIAVITTSSIAPYTDINKYAVDLSNAWGVGQKGKDNGLTIVLSKTLYKARISTGCGTEKVLTDEICQAVLDQTMTPKFRQGQFYEGIMAGLIELTSHWE